METKVIESLATLAQGASQKLTVQSALNPLLWLCGIVTPSFIGAAFLFKANPVLQTIMGVMAAIPTLVTCFVAVYFAIRKPENLQSEQFQIKNQALGLIREKTTRSNFDHNALSALLGEGVKALEQKEEKED